MNPSLYSYRINTSDEQVLIGGRAEYRPVCGKCYENQEEIDLNNKSNIFRNCGTPGYVAPEIL